MVFKFHQNFYFFVDFVDHFFVDEGFFYHFYSYLGVCLSVQTAKNSSERTHTYLLYQLVISYVF